MSATIVKRIVDTNVAITANRALDSSVLQQEIDCVLACVEAIESITRSGGLVLDAGDEIFDEYRANLKMAGQPGVGDRFMKWVHDHRWGLPDDDRVAITKSGDSYKEFPDRDGLNDFDL